MGDVGSERYEPALLPPSPTTELLDYSVVSTSYQNDLMSKVSTVQHGTNEILYVTMSKHVPAMSQCTRQTHKGTLWGLGLDLGAAI